MSVDWNYYSDPGFKEVERLYLPDRGEGDSKASQIVTAITKLVYKWYNDGDVYDNTGHLEGWANDLSSYANWLYKYVPSLRVILDRVYDCYGDDDYEDLLKDLAEIIRHTENLEKYTDKPTVGTIYDCDGPFEFREDGWEDEDEYEEEEMWEDEDEEED